MIRFGIPVIELIHPNPKGTFFFIHGHYGNKSLDSFHGLAESIHALGFSVVSLDAYKHGERIQAPYILNDPVLTTIEMVAVIEQTLRDIMMLYQGYYQYQTKQVSILGISMGGHIAFLLNRYLSLDYCIPIIGSPNLKLHYDTKKKPLLGSNLVILEPKLDELTLLQTEFNPKHAFVLEGEWDDVVNYEPAQRFIQSLNHDAYVYKGYACGHELTKTMIQDIITFVRSKL